MGLFDLLAGPVKGLIGSVGDIIDDLHTSGEEKAAAKLKLAELEAATLIQLTEAGKALVDAQRDVIVAEAKGESWIQRSWRPVAMLTLLGLIVWTVVPASIFSLELQWDAIPDKAWGLLTIGIGGYIGARTVEKVVRMKNGG